MSVLLVERVGNRHVCSVERVWLVELPNVSVQAGMLEPTEGLSQPEERDSWQLTCRKSFVSLFFAFTKARGFGKKVVKYEVGHFTNL